MHIKQIRFFLIILIFSNSTFGQNANIKELHYYFGTKESNNAVSVSHAKVFKENYGFDFQTSSFVKMKKHYMLATETVYFSIAIPDGNYKVTIKLGSETASTINTIKAESRRAMVCEEQTNVGEVISKTFAIDVKNAKINNTETVNLKDRERLALNWDEKLTLEFAKGTAVRELIITKIDAIKTLFLAGDSTVTDQDLSPWASWGQFITQYFNDEIVVANYASSGASLASFKGRKRWAKVLSLIKKGDYVMIEFGHNDEKRKGEGIGPWQSYSDLLKEYVKGAREKGATPILITPTQRRWFDRNGKLNDTHRDYPAAMRKVAKDLNVALIDLTKMTTVLYETWGDEISRSAFVQYPAHTFPGQNKALEDNTHFNDFGANEIALCVVDGIGKNTTGLEKYLKKISNYTPNKPNNIKNWTFPMSPRFEAIKPDGN